MKFLTLFLFALASFASDLAVGANEAQNKRVYAVQLFADKDISRAKETLSRASKEIVQDASLHKIGDYIVARWGSDFSYSKTKESLQKAKSLGFRDAYVVESTLFDMRDNAIIEEVQQTKHSLVQAEPKRAKLSIGEKSTLLLKAADAYKRGDEVEAMIYYEMLLAADEASQKIKNNLCYLYGKRGAWHEAKDVIDGESSPAKLIYAYAYGALQSNQESFYDDLAPYIAVDRSARLMLLAGSYFENRGDISRAFGFYKMAHDKNPTDLYVLFAYARALDMTNNEEALSFYKKAMLKAKKDEPIYEAAKKRVQELGK